MHGSDDEEVDEPLERDSDEDLSDDGSKRVDEEVCWNDLYNLISSGSCYISLVACHFLMMRS